MVLSDAVAEVGIKGLCRVDFDIDMGAFPDVDMNCILIFKSRHSVLGNLLASTGSHMTASSGSTLINMLLGQSFKEVIFMRKMRL